MHQITLEQYLIKNNFINEEHLQKALDLQVKNGGHVLEHLADLGFLSEERLTCHLAEKFNLPQVDESELTSSNELVGLIPARMVLKYEVLPLKLSNSSLTIATADPFNRAAFNEVKFLTGLDIKLILAKHSTVKRVIKSCYEKELYEDSMNYDELLTRVSDDRIKVIGEEESISIQTLEKLTSEAPIISLLNTLLLDAVKREASDIHIEPQRSSLRIRFRIDGILHEIVRPPPFLKDGLISRIKVLAKLDIAERRLPQDGKIRLNTEGREVDLRVSTLPTPFGESVVIRLLDRLNLLLDLQLIGIPPKTLLSIEALITQPHGMILVTGPTGSGKTTTLYAALNKINTSENSIITIEDPVEYELPGITQVQVKPQSGLTFVRGLRAAMRQDPDVIMVGEIRDAETAEIAVQAALTGHLVFSTLHTNDAAGAISRLMEIGIHEHLLKSSLLCVVGQRLVRRLCPACARRDQIDKGPAVQSDVPSEKSFSITPFSPVGCKRCSNTGYRGRIGIYELLTMKGKIPGLKFNQVDSKTIRETAVSDGMVTMLQDGTEKAQAGLTTMEEVLRVIPEDG